METVYILGFVHEKASRGKEKMSTTTGIFLAYFET